MIVVVDGQGLDLPQRTHPRSHCMPNHSHACVSIRALTLKNALDTCRIVCKHAA